MKSKVVFLFQGDHSFSWEYKCVYLEQNFTLNPKMASKCVAESVFNWHTGSVKIGHNEWGNFTTYSSTGVHIFATFAALCRCVPHGIVWTYLYECNLSWLQTTCKKATKHVCNMKIHETRSVCRGFSRYFTKQISCALFLHCFAIKVVTLQNTKGFSHEDVYEIT